MGVAHELLLQAHYLATYQGSGARQVDLRRAISAAYYAMFHLLVEDGGQRWLGGSAAAVTGLQRAFDHGPMKNTSQQYMVQQKLDWHGVPQEVPVALRRVARAFVNLQDYRHIADYDNFKQWSVSDAEDILDTTEAAFQDWLSIRADPIAGDYLLAMLLGKRR